jgi:hypothetical protein
VFNSFILLCFFSVTGIRKDGDAVILLIKGKERNRSAIEDDISIENRCMLLLHTLKLSRFVKDMMHSRWNDFFLQGAQGMLFLIVLLHVRLPFCTPQDAIVLHTILKAS